MTPEQHQASIEWVENLIKKGKGDQAVAFLAKRGYQTLDALKANLPINATTKWPKETPAEVWSFCRNKRLMVIRLPDGRQASCYRNGEHWPLGAKLKAKLLSDSGDPIYEPAPRG